MDWNLAFSEDLPRLTITASGPAEVGTFLEFLRAAGADPRWRPTLPTLLDFRQLDISILSTDDIEALADLHKPYGPLLAQGRIAVVVSRPVDFGLVRMWETFAQSMNLSHNVFYGLDEAEAWLAETS